MVKNLTASEKNVLAAALCAAESRTSAEPAVVVADASHSYTDFAIYYGLALGTAIAFGWWLGGKQLAFPSLLAFQLFFPTLFITFTILRRRYVYPIVPRSIRRQRAAHRAREEYFLLSQHVPSSVPSVLLYVSLAERYVHILPGRAASEKIPPSQWGGIVAGFTQQLASEGLSAACLRAAERMTDLLAAGFPIVESPKQPLGHHLIEVDRGEKP